MLAANQIQGAVQAARRDYVSSIASFKRAYELAPTDSQSMVNLVQSYVLANKSKEALAFLQSVLAASPQNYPARVLQAQVLAHTGNAAGARDSLQTAIDQNPSSPAAYQVLVNQQIAGCKEFGHGRSGLRVDDFNDPGSLALRGGGRHRARAPRSGHEFV